MITPDQMRDRLKQLPCPICNTAAYDVDPRHEESYADQIYTVNCQGCRYRFKASAPTRPIEQHDMDTANWLGSLPCPACQKRGATLDFRCQPSVRSSFHFLTCRACREPFMEQSPMEAFE